MNDQGNNLIEEKRLKQSSGLRSAFILSLVTMVLLWLSQEPAGWSWCVWFALIPWLVVSVRSGSYRRSALVSWICGSGYYIASLYWLANVTMPGMLALSVAMGLYFVFWGFLLKRIYVTSRCWFTLALPILWVSQEYLRATLLTGFPWLFLSHSLHEKMNLVQVADITGAYGVTFLAAMINGYIADLLLRPQVSAWASGKVRNLFFSRTVIVVVIFMSIYFYGIYRNSESVKTMSPGPIVSVVQGAVPQRVKDSGGSSIREIFEEHLSISSQAVAGELKPDLVVWPETMVLNTINQEYLTLADDIDVFIGEFQDDLRESVLVDRKLSDHASDNGVSLLIGTPSLLIGLNSDKSEVVDNGRANSAVMYNSDGSRGSQRYDKIHRVPFGEYIPFKESVPWLNKLLINLTPYGYDYSIVAGSKPVAFKITAQDEKEYTFTVAICYEDVIPPIARKLANWQGSDFMLNISNDGWFVTEADGELEPSSELMQHLVMSKYRAIENRIGIARAVNCGISGMVKPDGTVQTGVVGTLSKDDILARRAVSGYLTDSIWLDSRVSIYSRIGDVFAIVCTIITVLVFVVTLFGRKKTAMK